MNKAFNSVIKLAGYSDVLVVFGVIFIVVMMIIPIPTALLDILFATNISLSLMVLLLALNVKEPLELSVFPSLLLIATLFRLALSVSSTRLILTEAYAGKIIQAFGDFVMGGNYVVGFVIFLILVIVQFIVITKGAERVAEVSARFTLDAMPGKQMSIDADLNAGLISEDEARARRRNIEREADFYGSMDGASKFVKGDAIAGIIIVVIDIVGGLIIGMLQRNMDFAQALQVYTMLTVGDGLVSQIPALLMATATGIIVTRGSSDDTMGKDVISQLFANYKVLFIVSVVLFMFGLAPGLPTLSFFFLAGVAGLAGYFLWKRAGEISAETESITHQEQIEINKKPESVLSLLQVDQIELEIGYSLIPLVDEAQGGDMLERITMIRRQCALELGMVVPVIRIRDNLQLEPNSYVIKIKGIPVSSGEILIQHYMAMDSGGVTNEVTGIPTKEPAFGLDALWIDEGVREEAENAGYTVVDPPSVLATHLTEIIKNHAHELLGRKEVKMLLDGMKEEFSAVIDELIPDLMTLGEVQKVLQNLLREGIPIRNLVTILETLADAARITKDIDYLTEYVREALARQISQMFLEDGVMSVLTLDQNWEEVIASGIEHTERGTTVALDPRLLQQLFQQIGQAVETSPLSYPVILVAPSIRMALKRLTERAIPKLIVLSYNEISQDTQVQAVGVVRFTDESEKVHRRQYDRSS
ncbi:MAG: flagellar biosynthesis protein FlhA [Firmicutes bacterium]|nr:flagellar biosynthesis protein FlhA [Bacillota bacterium]